MAARAQTKVGRNDTCPCGSGKKYKHCCLARQEQKEERRKKIGVWLLLAVLLVALLAAVAMVGPSGEEGAGGSNQVWDPEHGHYHTVP